MPPYKSIGRKPLRHSDAYPALLAAVLSVLVASLIGVSSPQAASGADKSAPTAPQNLRLVGATQWSATVAWAPSSDNVGVEGYRVTFGSPRRAKTTETQYTETGLACGISYPVEVQAFDHVRNLSPTARAVVSSAPCLDVTPPTPPTGLQQIARSPTTATLAWQAATDNVAVAGYSVSRGGVEMDRTTETSYVFLGLNCGSTYSVALRAYDVSGNDSSWASFYLSTSACGDVTPPSAPSGLVQLDRTQTSMSFAWSASADNVGVAKYAVFRGAAQVAETTALTYALPGLTCGTAYTIGAEAVDGAGNRSQRTTATMSTASCTQPPPGGGDTQPPSVPSNVNVGSATTSTIALSWAPSTDNVGVTGYDVFRDGVRVSTVTGMSFTYTGLSCGQTYQLGVEAEDAVGNHSGRTSVVASTSPCADSSPPSPPGNVVLLSRTSTSVTVSWAASSDNVGVAGYGAYLDGTFVGSTGGTTYTFTSLVCGTSRTFGIDAYDAAGNRSSRTNVVLQTAACGDTQPPSTPTQLAVSGTTQTSLTLSWAASSDNVAVAGYDVYVNTSKVATVTGTSSTVGNLTCNTAYTLGVEAFDAAGNRSSRATASAATSACSTPPPPTGGGSLFVAPNGSDGAQCTQSAPCASFNRAYQVATPGDVVQVAGGSYPAQTIFADASKTSTSDVVFQPAPGASVTVNGDLSLGTTSSPGAQHVTIRDMKVTAGVETRPGTDDATFERMDAGALNVSGSGSEGVRILGGDYGPWDAGPSHVKQGAQNVLIDGARFHDFTITDPEKHSECLMIWGGAGRVTIRNSIFQNCTDFGILVKGSSGSILIENSMFDVPMPGETATASCNPGCPRGGNSLALSDGSGYVVRYSSFLGGIRVDPEVSNVVLKGNVGPRSSCPGNASYSYNVWSAAKCSASDRTAALSSLFVGPDSASFNLRLAAGAAAVGAGDGGDYPSRDLDGESRPQGGAPDSGADERT